MQKKNYKTNDSFYNYLLTLATLAPSSKRMTHYELSAKIDKQADVTDVTCTDVTDAQLTKLWHKRSNEHTE